MNQTIEKPTQTTKQNDEEVIKELTNLAIILQKQNLTKNYHPPLVTMNLIKWLKNIPVKSSEIIKLTGDICQYTLQKFQEKLKDAQENNQIENTTTEKIVNEFTIDFLVEKKWFISGLNSADNKEEVSTLIKQNLLELGKKTDNVYLLIYTILENTKSNSSLVKLLVEYITDTEKRENKIFLKAQKYVGEIESKLSDDNKKEMQQEVEENIDKFWRDVKGYLLIDNWQTKLTEDYQQDESLTPLQREYLESLQSINDKFNNKFKDNFWLLPTYLCILERKEILFNSQDEEKQLLGLGLIFEDNNNQDKSNKPRNKYQVINKIDEQVFSLNWAKNQIIQIQQNDDTNHLQKVQAIFNFTISDRFTETVNIIKHKFPNHIKTIIENTIFWTGRNSFGDNEYRFEWTEEEQSLTEKIFRFIEKYYFAEALFKDKDSPQEWFTENIMYSLFWKGMGADKITLEEFETLIQTRILLEEKTYDKVHLIKGLLRLASPNESQFKNNPLYVADKILGYIANVDDENEKIKRVTELVDYITENQHIIKDEEYFRNHPIDDQFYQKALDFLNVHGDGEPEPNIKKNKEESSIMSLNEKLKKIVQENDEINAILLVNLKQSIVRFWNPQLEDDENMYKKLVGKGGISKAFSLFKGLAQTPTALEKLSSEIGGGNFEFIMSFYQKCFLTVFFTYARELPFAICFLSKELPEASFGGFYAQCEENISDINKTLQAQFNRNTNN